MSIPGYLAGWRDDRYRGLKTLLFAGLSRLRSRAASPVPADPKRILILQLQQLGDTIVFTPAFNAIRRRFPNADVHLLCNPISASVYRGCRTVDRLIVADSWSAGSRGTRLRPLVPLIKALRREHYDIVIACVTEAAFKYSLIAWAVGAGIRVGFDIENRGALFTHRVPYRHSANFVELNLDVARMLGASTEGLREQVWHSAEDAAHATRLIAAQLPGSGPIILIHPASNWPSKTWFDDRWAAVGDALSDVYGARVALVGSPGDAAAIARVIALMRRPATSFAGSTTVPQLAALAIRCALFIGTDSGPRHVAGAVGAPTLVVASSQDDTDHWLGFRPNEIVLRTLPPCAGCAVPVSPNDRLCMKLISVEDVLRASARFLAAPTIDRGGVSEPLNDSR